MSNKSKNDSVLKGAIWGAIFGTIGTAIYDLIKEKPILSTLLFCLKWFWDNIICFNVPVWVLIILFVVYRIWKSYKNNHQYNYEPPELLNYTEGRFGQYNEKWRWKWIWNPLFSKWEMADLAPSCEKCGTRMKHMAPAICPRCGERKFIQSEAADVESVIWDTVERGLYNQPIENNGQI